MRPVPPRDITELYQDLQALYEAERLHYQRDIEGHDRYDLYGQSIDQFFELLGDTFIQNNQLVNACLALAIKYLIRHDTITPAPVIEIINMPSQIAGHLWTAFMILGEALHLPYAGRTYRRHPTLDETALNITEYRDFPSSQLNWLPAWFGKFSQESLYWTQFMSLKCQRHQVEACLRRSDEAIKQRQQRKTQYYHQQLLTLSQSAQSSVRQLQEIWALRTKADINIHIQDEYRRTALSYAAECGNLPIMRQLLQLGAQNDVNLFDNNRRTPLSYAAQHKHTEVVRLLLQQGAKTSISQRDTQGRTALSYAAQYASLELIELLLTLELHLPHVLKNDVEQPDNRGITPYFYSAYNTPDVIALFLQRTTPPNRLNKTDRHNRTLLSHAAEAGNTEGVNLLLSQNAVMRIKDNTNRYPYDYAQDPVLRRMLKGTALHRMIIEKKTIENMAPLVADPAERVLDFQDMLGMSALILAVKSGLENIAVWLLQNGANPFVRTINQRRAIDDADSKSLLYQRLLGYELLYAVQHFSTEQLTNEPILEQHRDAINFEDHRGYTAMMYALTLQKRELIPLLLRYRPNIDIIIPDKNKTIRALAIEQGISYRPV